MVDDNKLFFVITHIPFDKLHTFSDYKYETNQFISPSE